jgi:hypothetical protein
MVDRVKAIRIGFPSDDGAVRNKYVNSQPRDEVEALHLRAVHIIPRDLHTDLPMIRPPADTLSSEHSDERLGGGKQASDVKVTRSIQESAKALAEARITA